MQFALPFIILIPLLLLVAFGTVIVVVVVLFRSIFKAVFGAGRRVQVASRICTRKGCRASNATTARYCRRCGQQLMSLSSSVVMAA